MKLRIEKVFFYFKMEPYTGTTREPLTNMN